MYFDADAISLFKNNNNYQQLWSKKVDSPNPVSRLDGLAYIDGNGLLMKNLQHSGHKQFLVAQSADNNGVHIYIRFITLLLLDKLRRR